MLLYKNLVLCGSPVMRTAGGINGMLEIASCLIYAYRHNHNIWARKMANPEQLALLKQAVATNTSASLRPGGRQDTKYRPLCAASGGKTISDQITPLFP